MSSINSLRVNYRIVQNYISICATIGMIAGFLWSRGLLSVSIIILTLNCFWSNQLTRIWHQYKSNAFCIFTSLYFIIYFISGAWSFNQEHWWDIVVLKLPMLILPFAMWSIPIKKPLFKQTLLISILILCVIIIILSITVTMSNWDGYISNYNSSKLIPTLTSSDHIRLSLFFALTFLIVAQSLITDKLSQSVKIIYLLGLILLIIYLHLLAAKTGVLSLYIALVGIGFYFLKKRLNVLMSSVILALLMTFSLVIAYQIVPTFQEKVKYVYYEIKLLKAGEALNYNYSDLGRIISYKVALYEIGKMPFWGVGAGDVHQKMHQGYDALYPEIPKENNLIPHNQYLLELLTFGWLLSLVFVAMVLTPVIIKSKESYFSIVSLIIMVFALNVEAMLEVQFGIFVFIFFMMYWFIIYNKGNAQNRISDPAMSENFQV